jgi:phage tail-like protein
VGTLRVDPLPAFNFYISLTDSTNTLGSLLNLAVNYFVAGFSECSGLEANIEITEWREGGVNGYVHKFAGRNSYPNVTLRHGVIYLYDDLWNWHWSWVQGVGTRKDGIIVLQDEARNPAKIWKFSRGIPVKWTGPPLNGSQSAIAIESLEIAHEGLELELGA